jgi:hypothetical protein
MLRQQPLAWSLLERSRWMTVQLASRVVLLLMEQHLEAWAVRRTAGPAQLNNSRAHATMQARLLYPVQQGVQRVMDGTSYLAMHKQEAVQHRRSQHMAQLQWCSCSHKGSSGCIRVHLAACQTSRPAHPSSLACLLQQLELL